jgi:hypothetical protein
MGAVEGGVGDTRKRKPYDVWGQSDFAKELIKELNDEGSDVIELDYGLKMTREELPQIKSTDVPEFIEWVENQDIAIDRDPSMNPKDLTPTQKEINLEKVAGMVAEKGLESLASDKPVMISGDNYLIDGHHRWYALVDNDYPEISVVQIGLSVKDLISLVKDWDKTSYKSITRERKIKSMNEKMIGRVFNYLMNE